MDVNALSVRQSFQDVEVVEVAVGQGNPEARCRVRKVDMAVRRFRIAVEDIIEKLIADPHVVHGEELEDRAV
jgi:hypothetical protein